MVGYLRRMEDEKTPLNVIDRDTGKTNENQTTKKEVIRRNPQSMEAIQL